MNYYYAFIPGFNAWYLMSFVFIVAQAAIGAAKYRMETDSLGISPAFRNSILERTATAFAAIIAAIVLAESGAGITQFFDNLLSPAGDSAVYSVFLMPAAVVAGAVFYGVLLYVVGKIAAYASYGYLAERRRGIRRQRYLFQQKVEKNLAEASQNLEKGQTLVAIYLIDGNEDLEDLD